MLGGVLPEMRAQAEALAGDLADLLRVRNDIVAERDHLARDLAQLGHDQLRMNMLIDERQSKQSNAEQALDSERQRATDLARQVDGLKDLIGKLEANLDSANRAAHLAARAAEEGRPDVAALKRPRAAGPGGRVRRYARPLAAAGKRGRKSANSAPRTASAETRRAFPSPPAPARKLPRPATAGWFTRARFAAMGNS